MPLFEIAQGELVPFRRVAAGPDLYEQEIESLVWENFEEFTGEALFPIRRQASLPTGGIADIVALDANGRVVVFEIKRDIDRRQLAQCLEYAGWARTANLDEIAGMYPGGSDAFFAAWQDFTDSSAPLVINPNPRLVLVARDFESRTESAFEFLTDAGVPIDMVAVAVYQDAQGRRFIDVSGDHEVAAAVESGQPSSTARVYKTTRARIKMDHLIEAGLLVPGDDLTWHRPRKGDTFRATIQESGAIKLSDGREFSSPSRAAAEAAGIAAIDGWYSWAVDRLGEKLTTVRDRHPDLEGLVP